jgi:hypothetical protein
MISLLNLVIALLIAAQSPNVPLEFKLQALNVARQTLLSIQLPTLTPIAPPINQVVNQPFLPMPTASQPINEPVLGSVPTPSFSVKITKVTLVGDGGEFFFDIEGKTGTPQKPELILDEVTTNLRPGQVFYKVSPIEGTTNSYRVSISNPQASNPSMKVTINGETVEQAITF